MIFKKKYINQLYMKYTTERNREINKKLNGLKRRILISNMKSEAQKLLKNDGKIDENYKDFNDLKDDEFKRKALFNDYARKIIGNFGNITELEERLALEGNDLIHYFLNNYPRVMQEIKMYSAPTVDNLYNVIRKLYNREVQEIDLIDNQNNQVENTKSVLSLLKKISSNLKELRKFADTENDRNELLDLQQKFDAVMAVLVNVDDGVKVMTQLYGDTYQNVIRRLEGTVSDTSVPTDPNQALPVIDTPVNTPIQDVTQNTLATIIQSDQEAQKQSPQQQDAPEESPPQPKKNKKPKKDIDEDNDDDGKANLKLPTNIMDPNILSVVEDMRDKMDKTDYANYISQILGVSQNTVKSKGGTNKAMFLYFKKELENARENIRRMEDERKRLERDAEDNRKRKEEENDKFMKIRDDYRDEQLMEVQNDVNYLRNSLKAVTRTSDASNIRKLYNNEIRLKYGMPETKFLDEIRDNVIAMYNIKVNLRDTIRDS